MHQFLADPRQRLAAAAGALPVTGLARPRGSTPVGLLARGFTAFPSIPPSHMHHAAEESADQGLDAIAQSRQVDQDVGEAFEALFPSVSEDSVAPIQECLAAQGARSRTDILAVLWARCARLQWNVRELNVRAST